MNYLIYLMAGKGTRLNHNIPKQFIEINSKLLFEYALDTFLLSKKIDKVILVCDDKSNKWLKKYKRDDFYIINGSNSRTGSLLMAYKKLQELGCNNDDIIITHDCARPLISKNIIELHIKSAKKNKDKVINTYINSQDTLSSLSNKKILDREDIIRHQTPQSCSFKIFNQIFKNISKEQIKQSTDLCSLGFDNKIDIINILGSNTNFKVTTKEDLDFFNYIVKKNSLH